MDAERRGGDLHSQGSRPCSRRRRCLCLPYPRAPEGPPKGFLELAPELIAEIVSPTDRWQDIRAKLDDYFSIGVQQVWIVEPDPHSVLVYRSPTEAAKLGEDDTLEGEGVLTGFSLRVARLFTD